MILLAFCENCTWEILPMLIGAWLLGWLFWYFFHKPKYQNKIDNLTSNIAAIQTAAHAASLVDQEPNLDLQRLSDELKSSRNLNQDFNAQLKSLRSELENRQSESSVYQDKLDHLTELLNVSKQNNLNSQNNIEQLNKELTALKKRNLDLQQLLLNCEKEKEALHEKIAIQTKSLVDDSEKEANSDYEKLVSSQYLDITSTDTDDEIEDVFVEEDTVVVKGDGRAQPSYAQWLDSTNLKIVEGVGPKIESLMKNAGINNWEQLSNTEPSTIQNILNEAGPRYRVHDPKSWPLQARLAFKNDWIVLVNLQKEMGGGKSGTKDKNSPSKVEKLVMKAKGIKAYAPDDLKIVEGVGPKIEGLLKADGINNWSDLATTEPQVIRAILTKAGDRYRLADPTTWPKQASLAAKGNWEELKDYQDRLKGGIE